MDYFPNSPISVPVSQIKSLFKSDKTVISNNKENNKKPKENGAKKPKKPEQKPPEPPKQKPPKNIESALNGVRFPLIIAKQH